MTSRIKKWGNSAGFIVPSKILKEANLELDQEINIIISGTGFLVEPVTPTKTLKELIGDITPYNLHSNEDFGRDVGLEEDWGENVAIIEGKE